MGVRFGSVYCGIAKKFQATCAFYGKIKMPAEIFEQPAFFLFELLKRQRLLQIALLGVNLR